MNQRHEAFDSVVRAAVQSRGVALMGICNVTPDSFSDGGQHLAVEAARRHVDDLLDQGADIVDIGGESTRPSAMTVSASEQLARVLEVVRYAAEACRVRGAAACVSIDTRSPEVARACFAAGAAALNDVSCLEDEALADEVAQAGAAYVLMHSRPSHAHMAGFGAVTDSAYTDVVEDVAREWRSAAGRAARRGVREDALYMDPGLGFAKTARHSTDLLAGLSRLGPLVGRPLVVGASRKSFLRAADPDAAPADRLGASIAAALVAVRAGTHVLRVHDVRATRQALFATRLFEAAGAPSRALAQPVMSRSTGAPASAAPTSPGAVEAHAPNGEQAEPGDLRA